MYPNVGVSALDITSMPGLEAVIDVIYNPDKTELILRAEELGVPVAVGAGSVRGRIFPRPQV